MCYLNLCKLANFHWKFYLLCIALHIFCLSFSGNAYSSTSQKKEQKFLLIINSYNESAPWSQHLITPVLLQTSQMQDVEVRVTNMSGTLIRNDSLYKVTENSIFRRYRDRKPDYLLLIGNMSFNLRNRIQKEWGDIPMILVGDTDNYAPLPFYFTGRTVNMTDDELVPLTTLRKKYNFTFVETPAKYKETIDLMIRMLPKMKKLVFAADELYLNQRLDRLIQSYIASRYPELLYERLTGNEGNDNLLQKYLLTNDPSKGILFSTWFYDRKSLLGESTLVSGDFRLVASSSYPIFALRSDYVYEGGFVGGYFYDNGQVERSIADAIRRIVQNGESARSIPFTYSDQSYPIFNYTQMKIDNISVDSCPEGSVFLNMPPTFWEQYKWQIVCGLILLVTAVIIYLLVYISQKKRITLLSTYDVLVRNMPVFYMQGKVTFGASNEVKDVDVVMGNTLFESVYDKNREEMEKDSVFYKKYIIPFTELLFQEKKSISFLYYFKQSEKFYEVILCHSREKDKIDIFGMDVTARHQAEKALSETNKKLEMTLSVAHIIPWRWNLIDNTIACESGRILHHMGLIKESDSNENVHIIRAEDYLQRIHPDDKQRIQDAYQSLVKGSLRTVRTEFRILTQTEENELRTDWIEVNVMVNQTDKDGKPISLLGSLLLITARKQQEQALIAARERARESDRLKSAFLANMSHEIRTPLNAIVGFSNLLCATENESEKKEFVDIIENNNQLLLQLISDILDISKIEANTLDFNYQIVDLNEVFRNVENIIRPRLQPGVVLNMNLGASDCHIYTERNRLSQVIINLLTNACKFTSKGSISYGYEIHDTELYISVRDTGIGISKKDQEKIFERFAKLNSFIQGTGLGLSICQNIVKKMGGRIGIESEGKNKGSNFWFTIPYQPTVEEKPTVNIHVPQTVVREDIVILIAEDNESNYLLFKSVLGKKYKLLHAWDGVEAVELYKKHLPNIIIMDINMPNMDGYEATQEIRKISAKVPIIAVTAYAYASDEARIMKSGFNGYVSKPIDAHKLKNEIITTVNKNFILM